MARVGKFSSDRTVREYARDVWDIKESFLIRDHSMHQPSLLGRSKEVAMLIEEMTDEECRAALAHANVARLACEMDDQPYVVPIYVTYDGTYLFGFATMGLKIDCMRANPLVCVEIDEIKSQNQWMSVIVFGMYEELPDTPEYETTRATAHDLLQTRAMWWEPASVAVAHRSFSMPFSPIFYRIRIDRMTGRRASPTGQPAVPARGKSWLSKLWDPFRGN